MAAIYSDAGRELTNLVIRRSRSAGSAKLASMAVRVRPTSSSSLKPKCSWAIAYSPADAGAEVRRVVGAERERNPGLAQDGKRVLLVA